MGIMVWRLKRYGRTSLLKGDFITCVCTLALCEQGSHGQSGISGWVCCSFGVKHDRLCFSGCGNGQLCHCRSILFIMFLLCIGEVNLLTINYFESVCIFLVGYKRVGERLGIYKHFAPAFQHCQTSFTGQPSPKWMWPLGYVPIEHICLDAGEAMHVSVFFVLHWIHCFTAVLCVFCALFFFCQAVLFLFFMSDYCN